LSITQTSPQTHKVNKPSRFYSLDGLRGLAAVLVMICHYSSHAGGEWLFSGAYIAVDLFFILSGFVLIHSYGEKITSGMSFRKFALIRVVRLYPLFLVGIIVGLLAITYYGYLAGTLDNDLNKITNALLLNTFLIPYLNHEIWHFDTDILTGIIYPLNDPGWTLFFELFVNLLFFYYVSKFKNIKLAYLVVVSYLIYFVYVVMTKTANPGWGMHNFYGGFPRVISEFFMGILIYQHYEKIKARPLLTFIITAVVFGLMSSGDAKLGLINMFLLSPMLVLLSANIAFNDVGNKICTHLGDLSYPLYIMHVPIYHFMFNFEPISKLAPVPKIAAIALTAIMISSLLIRADQIVRNKLNHFFGLRRKVPAL